MRNKIKVGLMSAGGVLGSAAVSFAEDPTAATIITSLEGLIPMGSVVTMVVTLLTAAALIPLSFAGFRLVKKVVRGAAS